MKLAELLGLQEGVNVAPLAGAWIEISTAQFLTALQTSLPSRERGLKFEEYAKKGGRVAMSLPSRERGLKFPFQPHLAYRHMVAPLAGAWIEISSPL